MTGYAFGGERARRLKATVRQRIKANLAQLIADGAAVHEAGEGYLGLSRGQTARLWAEIKAELGEQAQ